MTLWESALASTLLHSLWEGAAVALVLALVLFWVRSSRARYAASAVAMLALAGGLVVTFTHFAPKEPGSVRAGGIAASSGAFQGELDAAGVAGPVASRGGHEFYLNPNDSIWVVPVWLAGVLIFYVRGAAGWVSARRLRRTGVCLASEAWRLRLDDLRARLRVARAVVLLESCVAEVPVAIGYVRPVILMPVGLLAGLPAEQVEAILLHELAHIRRHDYLVNLLQIWMEGLLFYHPAVWWISGVMRAERENCCDDAVVRVAGGALEYAKALAVLETRREFSPAVLAANGGGLVRRIQRLLGRPEQRFASAMPLVTAAGLTLCVATAMVGWQAPANEFAQKPVVLAQAVAPPPAAPAASPAAPAESAKDPEAVPPPAAPAAAPSAPTVILADHPIVPNDLLSITVYDEPGLSKTERVDSDGTIAMPALPNKIQVAGLMPRDVEKNISTALVDDQILLHPVVTVGILEYAERRISVVGDVKSPGQFTISAPMTLYEALAKAGWVTRDAGPEVLLTTPDSRTPRKINLQQLEMGTDPSLNVKLTGGEVVNVPDAARELAARFPAGPKVWVLGNVEHGLVYAIANPADATVLKAVARAGGVTQNYAKTAWIYRREANGTRRSIPVPLYDIMHRKAEDMALEADDILLIPESDTKNMQEYYSAHPLTAPWEVTK